MKRLIWTSDLHLDRMDGNERAELHEYLLELSPDGLIVAGDIAEAASFPEFLLEFRRVLGCPVYFVLGNHDFWDSSFAAVKSATRRLVAENPGLHWLTESGVVELDAETALVGHECWADGGYAAVPDAGTVPRDFMRIDDLKALRRADYRDALGRLGAEAADGVRKSLTAALAAYKNVYLVTHVPPFAAAALDRSRRVCDAERLPFYSCKAVGDVLLDAMRAHPEKRLTVLSGHTHERCEVEILDNLSVKVLDAGYGAWYQPGVIKI